jgi:hypothetical protein
MHLAGKSHAAKCRAAKLEEVMYVTQRDRLEYVLSGSAVIRTNHIKPKTKRQCQECLSQLPAGWEAFTDPESKKIYYWHDASQTVEWDRSKLTVQPGAQLDQPEANRQSQTQTSEAESEPRPHLPDGWEEHIDTKSGNPYYFHKASRTTQWERPEPTILPPGWMKVPQEDGTYYYADLETQTSQFEAPASFVHQKWSRQKDVHGTTVWQCEELNLYFYETDQDWIRVEDNQGRMYWSCAQRGIRFFEP